MSPLDSFWNSVLSLLTPIITPDWGKLIVLIPWLLLLLVLGFLARVVNAWVNLYRAQPVRGPKGRQRPLRPLVIAHVAVIALGAAVVAAAFIVGSRDPNWQNGGNSPLGLVVSLPLLILGLIIVISAAGSGARMWDRHGRDDIEPD
jgi:hydrogenase-4 membrane subunit HyfE